MHSSVVREAFFSLFEFVTFGFVSLYDKARFFGAAVVYLPPHGRFRWYSVNISCKKARDPW